MEKHLLVLIVLIISSFIYLKLAVRFNIIDKPNKRSSHTNPTIRGGGILFVIAIILFFLLNNFQYPYFFLGVIAISIISFLDDIYTLSSKIRFPFQFIAVYLVLLQVGLPFAPIYQFGIYLIIGIAIINMFNFMDGINGITGIYSLAVLSGLFFINNNEHLVNEDLIIFSIISILVFGFYNFKKKAIFFAGDIGSISIGMLIFFIGFLFAIKLSSPLILLLVIVYGADSGCTLLYRKLFTDESIFDPHRHHIYQKIVDVYKMPHLKVSIGYAFVQVLINCVIYFTYRLELQVQFILFFVLISFFIFCYVLLFNIIKNKNSF